MFFCEAKADTFLFKQGDDATLFFIIGIEFELIFFLNLSKSNFISKIKKKKPYFFVLFCIDLNFSKLILLIIKI
jgi:hypothetical protein